MSILKRALEIKNENGKELLLKVENLSTSFKLGAGLFASSKKRVYGLTKFSLDLHEGENYGIVGESGSGKTTFAKTIAGIYPKSEGSWHVKAGASMRYVFQDPAQSLNPRMTVYELLTHGYRYYAKIRGAKAKTLLYNEVCAVIESVGLSIADLERRPLEFSGGQRQRIALARALLFKPDILICDEVVSALDVSIQSQILNLLVTLKKKYQFSLIFIAHDLSVVSYLCDRVAVMVGGRLVEEGSAQKIATTPMHPYTKLLYASMPKLNQPFISPVKRGGELSRLSKPSGCPFASRCEFAKEKCKEEMPPLLPMSNGSRVACWQLSIDKN